ncbi:hypothetical protein PPERSA_13074 [Pseudocohnilembus persalinus]|uniref:Transmembrane protein n=1 Tax=Pseudocohnilembus persalinus TaxID=266149 RepID=A0A0V0QVZ9_PSEPJ|nr:hypothetical protein PPERSA_13074 [Pseudocohnilembus persalinus]|eukprot:KRX06595.1 hypothetical protein PPERSA_13074 [Pseudocohnilembus persalinus]
MSQNLHFNSQISTIFYDFPLQFYFKLLFQYLLLINLLFQNLISLYLNFSLFIIFPNFQSHYTIYQPTQLYFLNLLLLIYLLKSILSLLQFSLFSQLNYQFS